MAEKNSLWKNIRKKAEQNRRTGATPKKPTREMLRQERKIKAQYPDGGPIGDDNLYNIQRALELGYTSDETGHWPSVDSETGAWLKSKEHPTAWMEYMYGYALNPEVQKQYQHPVVNPEGHFGENQLQYNLKPLVQSPELLDDTIIYPSDNPYKSGVNKDVLDSEYDSYMRWREGFINSQGMTPEKYYQTYPSRQEYNRQNFNPANLNNGVSLAQGGYVDGDKDKKKKTKIYTDPEEFKIAQRNFNDSLDVYNLSQKININPHNLPEIDKNTFKSLQKKDKTVDSHTWAFDEVSYKEDKKKNQVKDFKDYMYEYPQYIDNSTSYEDYLKKLREISPQYNKNYPIKDDTPDKIVKLKNEIERHYQTYKGEIVDNGWYTDIYPNGTSRSYSDNKLFDIHTPNIKPVDYKYYGEDKPKEYNKFSLSSKSTGWYKEGEKPKFKNTSNESFVDYYIPTDIYQIYKKPEVEPKLISKPIISDSTKTTKPALQKLQSKQYSNSSSNQQPGLVGNIENIQPLEINMDNFYEGQYEKYRRSPYEDPMYRVWVPGQKMDIVSEEEFKKLNDKYALKDLEQKAQGGYMYDGGGTYANQQGVIMGPIKNPNGSYTLPVSNEGLPQVNLPEFELKLEENPYGPITEEEYLSSSFNPLNWVLPTVEPYQPKFRPDGTLIPAPGKIDPHYIETEFIGAKKGKQALDKFKDLDYKDVETFKNSSVKNILNDSKNKILKTAKDIKSAADEFIVTPIQFKKEIKELKKLKENYPKIFNTEEGKKRLGLLGIDPSKISDYNLTFKPNVGSSYFTGFDDFINEMNIDFRELQRAKKEGYMLSPKSVFEHELGHLLQKESYKQKKILSDLKQYDLDLKKYDNEMLDYNNQVERINNNPFLNEMDKRFKIASTRKPIEPQKPLIQPKKTLIDKRAKHLTRNDDIINDELIAASNIEGTDILTFPEKSYSYFNTELEKFPHLREMRNNMIESGIIKNIYDPITNEDLLKFITNNPGDRVASFINRSPNNIELLRNLLNHIPAAIPAIGIGAKVLQQNSEPQQQAQGGHINPYMYYAGGPMQYDVGGKVWKNIAAGLYGAGEGILDTITMGATDQLTDRGFEYLTKVGNKNLDLNDPDDVKFLKTQQQVKGYSNAAGAIGTAIVTGNVQGAISQGTKGLNTAFQASDWASDDFKKWSQGISGVAGVAAGFAGGLNSDSFNAAAKAGTGVAGFGQKAGEIGSFGNQVAGMFGGNQQPLWQQGQARQDYLNSPEYLAIKERENQTYVNQGLSFAANGGNINNNSLNLQINSMRNRYKKYKQGGSFQQYGINKIPDSAGYHHENAYGGVPIGQNAMAEGGEYVLDGNYVVSDGVDGMNTQTDEFGKTMAENLKKDLSKYTMRDLNSKNREQERRPNDAFAQSTIDQIKQKAIMETEIARQQAQIEEQQKQSMVDGALQYAASGGKLSKDIEKIVMEEYAAAYGGYINPKKYNGLNMPGGKLPKEVLRAKADNYVENYAKGGSIHIKESKKGTFTAAAKKRGKSVQEFARQVLANKDKYSAAMVKKANFARNAAKWKHAEGGPMISNIPQPFEVAAQNRGGMMVEYARGGNMYAMGGPDGEFGPITEAQAIASGWQPQYQDEIDYTQMPDIRYTIPPVETIQPINSLQSTIQTPKIIGNIQDIPTYYNQPSSFENSDGEIPIINPIDFGSDLNYNNGQYTIKSKGMPKIVGDIQAMPPVSKVDVSDSTTPWYDEPLYSKAARYSQAIPGVIASITAMQNKKRKLTPERITPNRIDLERSRITTREENRRGLDFGLRTIRGGSSNTGQLAANTKDAILNYNKNMGANIAKLYETEENANAQLAQQAALANQQYGNAFKQLNEENFQNAQTQAIAGLQDTTGKLAGAAGEERKQYLQEWIAKNKLKTRDFIQGPDGSYYYEGPDGTLNKVQ